MFVGPLSQFQMLYACERMGADMPKMASAHDQSGKIGLNIQEHETDSAFENLPSMMNDGMVESSYCDVYCQISQMAESSLTSGSQTQRLLLLDTPQAIMPLSLNIPEKIPVTHILSFTSQFSPPLFDEPIYLLTQRLRL